MKAQMLIGIRQIEMRDVENPQISNPEEVLVKVKSVGICGSDVHYFETGRIGSQVVQFPFIVGHECAGQVVEAGSAVGRVQVGDAIVIDPLIACGRCDQCVSGRVNTCRDQKFLGCPSQVAGCLCEYIVMSERCCFPTKNRITPAQAVLCEPFAIGIYAVEQAQLKQGAQVGILGAGPIGLSVLEACKAGGIETVYMTELIPERVKIAKQAGAVWVGSPNEDDIVSKILEAVPGGLDAVFECAGKQETLDQGVEMLKPGGKLMVIGIPREDRISFIPDQVRRKEIPIIHVRRQNKCMQKAIDLLAERDVNLDYMITHHFNFNQTAEAFGLVAQYRGGIIKAIIEM